ncbi:RraA family protein [Embleya scabrispora]|uniref:RraA family protein n=1 Tax=Embleya scabrispora TaxID=159449 RepID=UPI000381449E|nr:RraA family protein [Embleya scabrispora]MYS86568.1 RraA family protein [Streptomyces sp. SID5474]
MKLLGTSDNDGHRAGTAPTGTEEDELLEAVRTGLSTPVVGDILDQMGHCHQFLPPEIHGISPGMVVVGRAMPVLIADCFGPQNKPFGLLTEALDDLCPGEVYVARGSRLPCSAWGEILTATARNRGSVGAVIDGFHRDTPKVLSQDWPVFSRGAYAQDAAVRTQVVDYRVPVEIGGVTVRPGDLVFGDIDGIVVVPREIEAETVERALHKASTENLVRRAIEDGMSATAAFAEYGVL